MVWAGVSSTRTGAIRNEKSALVVSVAGALDCIPGCICDRSNFAAPNSSAATPPSFTKSLRFTGPSPDCRALFALARPEFKQMARRRNRLMPKSRVQVATVSIRIIGRNAGVGDEINPVDRPEVLGLRYYQILGLDSYSAGSIRLRSLLSLQIAYSQTGHDL